MKIEFSPYIAIQVNNNKKAAEFYQNVLGMKFINENNNNIYLNIYGINFVLENYAEGKGNVFFEFKTDNIAALKKILIENGCKITQKYSEKSIMFSDPYGMNFHLWQE
jgi:predicted enzyme related to lactoylglutathione lyase